MLTANMLSIFSRSLSNRTNLDYARKNMKYFPSVIPRIGTFTSFVSTQLKHHRVAHGEINIIPIRNNKEQINNHVDKGKVFHCMSSRRQYKVTGGHGEPNESTRARNDEDATATSDDFRKSLSTLSSSDNDQFQMLDRYGEYEKELSRQTNRLLLQDQNDAPICDGMELMAQWRILQEDIRNNLLEPDHHYEISYLEQRNKIYTNTNTYTNINIDKNNNQCTASSLNNNTTINDEKKYKCYLLYQKCVEAIQTILDFSYTNTSTRHMLSTSSEPFEIAIKAWRDDGRLDAGCRAASVLDLWASNHGGNMELAPTKSAFDLVMESYALAGMNVDGTNNNNNNNNNESYLPGERAWEFFSSFSGVGHMSMLLRPDALTCSHLIRALTNHLVFIQKEMSSNTTFLPQHLQSQPSMNAYLTTTRIIETLTSMESKLNDENPFLDNTPTGHSTLNTKRKDRNHPSLEAKNTLYIFILRAYSDALHASLHGSSKGKHLNNISSQAGIIRSETLLTNMINHAHNMKSLDNSHTWMKVIAALYVEDAHLSAITHLSSNKDPSGESALLANDLLYKLEQIGNINEKANPTVPTWLTGAKPRLKHYSASIKAYVNCLDAYKTLVETNSKNMEGTEDIQEGLRELAPHRRCKFILHQIIDSYGNTIIGTGLKDLIPLSLFELVIRTYLRAIKLAIVRNKEEAFEAAKEAESILNSMLNCSSNHILDNELDNDTQYLIRLMVNEIMTCYAQCDHEPKALKRVESLFYALQNSHDGRGDNLFQLTGGKGPNEMSYNAYLTVLSRIHSIDAGEKAWDLIKFMEMEASSSSKICPNIAHYSCAIKALANIPKQSRHNRSKKGKIKDEFRSARMANDLLDHADENCTNSSNNEENRSGMMSILYSSVIDAWANSCHFDKNGVENVHEKVMQLFERLINKYEDSGDPTYKPDARLYASVLSALGKVRGPKQHYAMRSADKLLASLEYDYNNGIQDILPDKYCFVPVINAWAHSRDPVAIQRVEDLLNRMEALYSRTGDMSIKPDIVAYSAVINAWSKSYSPEAVERSETLLRLIEQRAEGGESDVNPNVRTYTLVINALWKSGEPDAAERAEAILQRMENHNRNKDIDFIETSVYSIPRPDAFTYASVINTWGRSPSKDKAMRAYKLLRRMEDRYNKGDLKCKPNTKVITSVLNACAHTVSREQKAREEAVKIALLTQKYFDLMPSLTPNSVSFRTLLEVFGKNMRKGKDRSRLITLAFEKCCYEGLVDNDILTTLRRYEPELYSNLPSNSKSNISLPNEWTRNLI